MGDRVILHSDINSCYASIELLHHPELRGKPLAVGGDPEARHGIVLTADYVAKKHGVKTGMALWQASGMKYVMYAGSVLMKQNVLEHPPVTYSDEPSPLLMVAEDPVPYGK